MRNLIVITLIIGCVGMSIPQESQNPAERILGTWYSQDNPSTRWVYQENGTLLKYRKDKLSSTFSYNISHRCGKEYDPESYFMKWVDQDGDVFCFEINGINENKSGLLSITSMRNGKVILYER